MKYPQIETKIPIINSIFTNMEYDFKVIEKPQLDILFVTTYGQRNIAPLVLKVIKSEEATQEELKELGRLVLSVYKNKWDRYLNIYGTTYNPIYNYHDEFTENIRTTNNEIISNNSRSGQNSDESFIAKNTRTDDLETNSKKDLNNTVLRTDNLSTATDSTINDNTIRTDNLTRATNTSSESSNNNNSNDSVYAFNSTDAVNSNAVTNSGTNNNSEESTVTDTGTQSVESNKTNKDTIKNTGTQENSSTGSETDLIKETGTQIIDNTSTKTSKFNKESTNASNITSSDEKIKTSLHSGNIGNLTTQQLIEQEIKIWEWNFVETVLNDVKEMLTLPMYIS